MSQRIVASEPVTERLGTEVDADEDPASDFVGNVRCMHRRACKQACRQVVDEIAGDRDADAAEPAGLDIGPLRQRLKLIGDHRQDTRRLERLDENEQAGDERNHRPGDVLYRRPRALALDKKHDRHGEQARDEGRQAELKIERGRGD